MDDLAARLQASLGPGYRVERELGGGGMSRVFVAAELELGREVVVKVLPPEMALGVSVERFRREIQLAASLQHPHIVPLLSAGHAGDLIWYTMPLLQGESLRVKVAREGELPVTEALHLLREVADALAHAHQRGVVHRDIKPDNILLSGTHAVVTDFGVAKAITAARDTPGLTSVGVALGTPAYMAPEQAVGSAQVDHRADIYAVGAVAYELLTGRPPFDRPSAEATLAAQVTEAPEPLARYRAAVPAAISAVIMRCLEKKPADRWQSAAELHAALEAAATVTGGAAPAGTARGVVGRLRGGRARLALGLAASLLIVALVAYGVSRVRGGAAARTDRSVAVLTFVRLSSDTGDAYLAEGLADGISTALAKIGSLRLTSRTAVRRVYDGGRLDPSRLGHVLDAANLVGGTIQRVADHLQVTVELVLARTGEELWTERYDTTTADLLGVQARIAEAVAGRVAGRLLPAERATLTRRPTASPAAYDHYLRGNRLVWSPSEASVLSAIAQYQAALALDSGFSAAWGRLAQVYGVAVNYAYRPGGLSTAELLARGMAAADRAVRADSSIADGWLGRGTLLSLRGGTADFVLAEDALRRSVALDASNDAAHHWYAVVLRRLGRFDQAEQEYYRVLAINPTAQNAVADLGFLAFSRRSYRDAVRWYVQALAMDSTVVNVRLLLARSRSGAGDLAGALADAKAGLGLASVAERVRALSVLAEMEHRSGDTAAARRHFSEALRQLSGPAGSFPPVIGVRTFYEFALAAVTLGDRDVALRSLERTQPRGPWLWSYLIWEGFDPVRGDPRFRRVFDEVRPPGANSPGS